MRLALALLPALALLALPRAARADGLYFTEAYGGTHIKNELGVWMPDTALHVHAGLGYRSRQLALEVWMGADIDTTVDEPAYGTSSPMVYGFDAKYLHSISKRLEVYARGSMSRMQLDHGPLDGYGGRGLGVGTGIQLKGKAPLVALLYPPIALVCLIPGACRKLGPMATVALYFDEGYDFYRLHERERPTLDAEATRWKLGFAVGMDF
jgi:hypothetical protein